MDIQKKSLIDNWSLEQAGFLLDGSNDYLSISDQLFTNFIGGLSNYINSLLLYDETNYLANGFESEWSRFNWFERNTKLFVRPINPDSLNINWNSKASYSDKGIKNYLVSSKELELDLFVSPERATKIKKDSIPKIETAFETTLKNIDEIIRTEKDALWFDNIKVGIDTNFFFPSLTHYVMSESSNADDIFTVIMQLKESNKVKFIRDKISEITKDTKKSSKFQKNIEKIIKEAFGDTNKSDTPWSLTLTVLFLTLTKSFSLDFFKRKEHLLFLKDIVKCRSEVQGLKKDIERVFGRSFSTKQKK